MRSKRAVTIVGVAIVSTVLVRGEGARLVRDVAPDQTDAGVFRLAELDGLVYFRANDFTGAGWELWRTDGTEAGTVQVADIHAGGGSSNPEEMQAVGPFLYFAADDGIHGNELWRTDGTADGTTLVADVWPGEDGSDPEHLRDVGGTLFFTARAPDLGRELWTSDGTATGTSLTRDIADGLASGLNLVRELVALDGILYFPAVSSDLGQELWRSDGTEAGTSLVLDLDPEPFHGGSPRELTVWNGELYFGADDGVHGDELWRTDGTAAGTTLVVDLCPGACDGLGLVLDVRATSDRVYFSGEDGVSGAEPWLTDGTPGGTALVADVCPGLCGSRPAGFTQLHDRVLFSADDDVLGTELWSTDGTPGGTALVEDIRPGGPFDGSGPSSLMQLGDRVYFTAFTDAFGQELWRTDGTPGGTRLVSDVCRGECSSLVSAFAIADGRLFFAAEDLPHGEEVWTVQEEALLSVTGSCPGPIQLQVEGATPDADLVLFWSPSVGITELPATGPCGGTELDLATANALLLDRADATGSLSLEPFAPAAACGARLQVLDRALCCATNPVAVP